MILWLLLFNFLLFAKNFWWRGLTRFCDSLILNSQVTLIQYLLCTYYMFGIVPSTKILTGGDLRPCL